MKKILWILVWIIGLIVITYFAYQQSISKIESSLVSEIRREFSSNGIKKIDVSLQSENNEVLEELGLENLLVKKVAVFKGMAKSKSELSLAKELALEVSGIEQVISNSVLLPKPKPVNPFVSPFTLSLTKTKNQKMQINGYASSISMKNVLLHTANNISSFSDVSTKLKVATGAPEKFDKLALLGLETLGNVDEGSFSVIGDKYVADFVVNTKEKKEIILEQFNSGLLNLDNFNGDLNVLVEKEVIEDIDPFFGDMQEEVVIKAKPKLAEVLKLEKKPEQLVTKENKKDCQAFIDSKLSSQYIQFAYKKTTLKGNKSAVLDSIIEKLKECDLNDTNKIEIGGHTDSIGSAKYNRKLSEKRALSVKWYMMEKGISKSLLKAVGYGESSPIASNKTKSGQAKNRRIEIKILKEK